MKGVKAEAAKFLKISFLWYFLCITVKTGKETLKGYTMTKITDYDGKVKRITLKIEVMDIDTKEVTIYPSLSLAGKAFNVRSSSLSGYFSKKKY